MPNSMTANLVAPTAIRPLSLLSDENSDFESWKEKGETLVNDFRKSEKTLETNQWAIGDWIVRGVENEKFGKEKAYDEAERITGFGREYLQTVVWVVNRFRDSSLRKDTRLKWSHFKELAYIDDKQLREKVLEDFNDGLDYSVRDVRERVARELAKGKQDNGDPKRENTPKQWVSVPVSLKPDHCAIFKRLAEVRRTTPDKLLGRIVTEYFEENKKEITAEIEKAKGKR